MALFWNRSYDGDFAPLNVLHQEIEIGQVPVGTTLKRTIVQIQLEADDMQNVADQVNAFRFGATVAIQYTPNGATPNPLGGTTLGVRDLLWITQVNARPRVFNNAGTVSYVAPGDGGPVSIDTSVQRAGVSGSIGRLWLLWTWNFARTGNITTARIYARNILYDA